MIPSGDNAKFRRMQRQPGRRPVLYVLADRGLERPTAPHSGPSRSSFVDARPPLLPSEACYCGNLLVMSPEVTAAIIAADVGVLNVAATVAVQISGRRATSRDTHKAREELRRQLDRTLAEQRARTLDERFAAAAGQQPDGDMTRSPHQHRRSGALLGAVGERGVPELVRADNRSLGQPSGVTAAADEGSCGKLRS